MKQLPSWMVFVGAVVAVVGVVVMVYASTKRESADLYDQFTRAYGASSHTAAHYATLSHWGLGLLIAGAVVALAGFTAMAIRK